MSDRATPSPLDRIPDLEPIAPEKVRELEEYLATTYLSKIRLRQIEQEEQANELRKVVLY